MVEGFGEEWTKFNYSNLSIEEQKKILNSYFKIFPWDLIDKNKSVGIDIGCGSGRWAYFISEKTYKLILIDLINFLIVYSQSILKILIKRNWYFYLFAFLLLHKFFKKKERFLKQKVFHQ